MGEQPDEAKRGWLVPLALALAVAAAYAPSLGGGFLGYDDDWLVRDNPVMNDASASALAAIVSDFSRATRLVLGAEYLPVRDLVTWAAVRAFGTSAPALRGVLLALYVAAVLAWRAWIRRLVTPGWAAELATLAFALHPVHAESVAWLAGFKDVLALLFSGLALALHVGPERRGRRTLVVLCVALACLSKAVSVVLPALLWISDAWLSRAAERRTLAASALVAVAAAVLHASIGARVGMYAAMPGGSRLAAMATMAPVAYRYALRTLLVEPASVVYDVPDRTLGDPLALAALAGLAALAAWAIHAYRRGERRPALLLALVACALAPVSEVVAPIQHRMADRYLLVAIVAPCLALGLALGRLGSGAPRIAAASLTVVFLGGMTGVRAATFADPIALFSEAAERAPASSVGPYQVGVTLERTRPELAEAAYREALGRDGMTTDTGRRAADNLAILLARSGRAGEAVALLEDAHARYPDDPRVAHNLAVLLDARGDHDRAREMLLEVLRRAPEYARARESYRARWGEPPVPAPAGAPRYGDGGDAGGGD